MQSDWMVQAVSVQIAREGAVVAGEMASLEGASVGPWALGAVEEGLLGSKASFPGLRMALLDQGTEIARGKNPGLA